MLTRRAFVETGGALVVSLLLPGAEPETRPVSAWLEIREDGAVVVRTGRTETGTGMTGFYTQTVAEELQVRPESITLVLGDTDRTPDGGYSAGFLTGAANLRKVAAYARQALLQLAAAHFSLAAGQLTVEDGTVRAGSRTVTYAQLVAGRRWDLRIPVSGKAAGIDPSSWIGMTGMDGLVVDGDPPLRPITRYQVVGTSYPMPGIPDKVTGRTEWTADVRLPGLLHARMIRPPAIGAALLAPGPLDAQRFPTALLARMKNLLAVVSPDEWEAIRATQSVAGKTHWSPGTGLAPSDRLTETFRAMDWNKPITRGPAEAPPAARTLRATYEQAYIRHAPLGPFVSVADVKPDGSATVWTHSSHSQGLRARLALLLGQPIEKVVVRWRDQAGQYGRTTYGGDGADADAVILSQLTGRPVRVQWSLEEDLAWSSLSPGFVADGSVGLDAAGRLQSLRYAFYSSHQFDARLFGAILAGRPNAAYVTGAFLANEWPYDLVPHLRQEIYGGASLGDNPVTGGLRGNIFRTPGQRQQNFVVECLVNEAAAAAGADPIQYRLDHTTDDRLINILKATAQAAGWQPRPRTANFQGRGVCVIVRANAYWVGIAEIEVNRETGVIRVPRFTIGIECGKIINPRQLDRCMRGGLLMGISEALKEEVTFDNQRVTSTDWTRYPILTMAETPQIRVVQISRDDKGFGTGGEAANAVAPAAIAAAFHDATGIPAGRLPLTPVNVRRLLGAAVQTR